MNAIEMKQQQHEQEKEDAEPVGLRLTHSQDDVCVESSIVPISVCYR